MSSSPTLGLGLGLRVRAYRVNPKLGPLVHVVLADEALAHQVPVREVRGEAQRREGLEEAQRRVRVVQDAP